MIKNILAIATVVVSSACSSSDNNDSDNVTPPVENGGTVTPPGKGEPPATATKAGAYIGPIAGSITPFGDVSLLSFTWNGNTCNGVVFFAPGATGQLVFPGETTDPDASNTTIASLLT